MRRAAALLVALAIVAGSLFAWNRSRSPFLAAEREVVAARALALEFGVALPEVLALREGVGVELGELPWRERVARWKAVRDTWPSLELAVLALLGRTELVNELLAAAAGDPVRAERLLADRPEHVAAVRFVSVAGRFASRL